MCVFNVIQNANFPSTSLWGFYLQTNAVFFWSVLRGNQYIFWEMKLNFCHHWKIFLFLLFCFCFVLFFVSLFNQHQNSNFKDIKRQTYVLCYIISILISQPLLENSMCIWKNANHKVHIYAYIQRLEKCWVIWRLRCVKNTNKKTNQERKSRKEHLTHTQIHLHAKTKTKN